MTKAGRKRKLKAKRSPSGKVNSWEDPRVLGEAKRIRDKIRHTISHPHYGFPLGTLHAEKAITDAEFDAGMAWATLAFRFRQMQGIHDPVPKAVNFAGRLGAPLGVTPSPQEVARVKAELARMDGVIATADHQGIQMMFQCCIEDLEPWAPSRLRKVLTALAEFRASGRNRKDGGKVRRALVDTPNA